MPDSDPDWDASFTPVGARRVFDDSDDDSFDSPTSVKVEPKERKRMKQEEDAIQPKIEITPVHEDKVKDRTRNEESIPKPKRKTKQLPKKELPLVVASRLDDNVTLLGAEGVDLDMSGDIGVVGRVKVDEEMDSLLFDLKGTVYSAHPYWCNSACVVNVSSDRAQVKAVMNAAVLLRIDKSDRYYDAGCLFDEDGDVASVGDEAEMQTRERGVAVKNAIGTSQGKRKVAPKRKSKRRK